MENFKPSVTKIIGQLDKPALLNWANKIGLEGIKLDEYRKKVMSDGTSIHKQIEEYHLFQKPFTDPETQKRFEKLFKDKKILEIEKNIETDHWQGRMDLKIEWLGKTYVCDFKSNQKNVYLENKLQLIAYRMAEPSDGIAIISVPDFKIIPVSIYDYKPYEDILIRLAEIYNLKMLLEN